MTAFVPSNVLAILPETLLLALGLLVLTLDPFWKEASRRLNLGWLTTGGLLVILAVSLALARPS
ncbi:MAG: hypothetical protein Q8M58_05170, partial [Anaerolineales bacterium]|nr:hypothetical protein [Anaerolineales bacterium]